MRTLLLFITPLFLFSCDYDNAEELYPSTADCVTTNLYYEPQMKTIIDQNCSTSGCHDGASGLIDLTNYTQVKAIIDNGKFSQRVLIEKNMPPSGPLSDCEIKQLTEWISNGAPKN